MARFIGFKSDGLSVFIKALEGDGQFMQCLCTLKVKLELKGLGNRVFGPFEKWLSLLMIA